MATRAALVGADDARVIEARRACARDGVREVVVDAVHMARSAARDGREASERVVYVRVIYD